MKSLIYIDLDREQARSAPGTTLLPVVAVSLITPWSLSLHCHRTGSTHAVDMSSAGFKLVLKLTPTSDALLYDDHATMEGGRAVIETMMDSSTLRTALGDQKAIQVTAEIEWTLEGESGRAAWPMTVRNAFVRPGDEAPPPAAAASEIWLRARALRHDEAQTLSNDAKAQARANLGLGHAAMRDVGSGADTVCAGNDSRLSDSRPPTGGAGGVLSGSFPNPGFAVDMATQSELNSVISDVTAINTQLPNKASLVGGKVPSSELPTIAITTYLGAVASQAAMLLLLGDAGDFCFRTDQGVAYFLTSGNGSQLSHWQAVSTPASVGVVSVNGHVGVVVLSAADVGAAPTTRSISTQHSLQGGGNLSANRVLSLVGDSASPGANKLYGTDSLGDKAWRRALYKLGPVQIYGHMNPSTPSAPPPSLVLTFSSNPTGHFEIVDEGNSQVFSFAGADPSNGSTWIDTSGLSEDYQIAEACETALLSSFLADLQISRDGAVVTVGRTNEGADYSLNCMSHSGMTDVTGGGSGTNEGPPSGGLLSFDFYSGPGASIIAAYWWSEGGLGAGVELIDFSDDTVISTVSAPGSSSSGVLSPNSMAGAQKFNSLSSLRLRCVDDSIEGGDFSLVLFMM